MANKAEERGDVVILFQDMLEVVTKDIMDEEFPGYGTGFLFFMAVYVLGLVGFCY